MTVPDEVAVLARAYELFAASPAVPIDGGPTAEAWQVLHGGQPLSESAFPHDRQRAAHGRTGIAAGGATDAQTLSIPAGEHIAARQRTPVMLDVAQVDSAPAADTPMGQRELLGPRVARLRRQHRAVWTTRSRALRRRLLLRALQCRARRGPGARGPQNTALLRKRQARGLDHTIWRQRRINANGSSSLVSDRGSPRTKSPRSRPVGVDLWRLLNRPNTTN